MIAQSLHKINAKSGDMIKHQKKCIGICTKNGLRDYKHGMPRN